MTPTATPPPTGGCAAAYSVVGQWPGGFQGEVKVTVGSAATKGWTDESKIVVIVGGGCVSSVTQS